MEAATKRRAPRASDGLLAGKIGALMLFLFGGRADQVLRVIDESGLTFVQMKALVTLETALADVSTVSGLADALGLSPASASRAADGLVRKRLVSRVEDPDDRRVRRLKLTAKGNELAGRIISARIAGLEDFAASLSPRERELLEGALDALMEREEIAEIYETHATRLRR